MKRGTKLKIAVCIKQVPASSEVKMDENTGVLMREGNSTKINPYDLFAIETSLRLKEKYGGSVHAFSMGPPSATEAIITSYSLGVDTGFLLCDKVFAGSDVYTTSLTLAKGISITDHYDVIVCGMHTTDGDTGQVGPSIATHLHLSHIYNVVNIEEKDNDHLIVVQKTNNKHIKVKVKMPCVLITSKESYKPRLPSLKLKLKAKKKKVNILTFKDLKEKSKNRFGLNGSPTQVEKIYLPKKLKRERIVTGDVETLTNSIIENLKKNKFI